MGLGLPLFEVIVVPRLCAFRNCQVVVSLETVKQRRLQRWQCRVAQAVGSKADSLPQARQMVLCGYGVYLAPMLRASCAPRYGATQAQ